MSGALVEDSVGTLAVNRPPARALLKLRLMRGIEAPAARRWAFGGSRPLFTAPRLLAAAGVAPAVAAQRPASRRPWQLGAWLAEAGSPVQPCTLVDDPAPLDEDGPSAG
ncbi:hypothetical protein [Nonomuraea sp. NPDC049504]|uniref:hypothetical protein n=1 Tax=Nonomuraea sp. NPDC049504 TaxID=3154729 RepID=UPI0034236615